MLLKLYTIYDMKVQAYLRLFPLRSHGEALRVFADMANDSNSQIGQHPEDYILYCVGEFDDARGIITALDVHELLGKAVEYVTPPSNGPLFENVEKLDPKDRFEQEAG